MQIDEIVKELRQERDRIEEAIHALTPLSGNIRVVKVRRQGTTLSAAGRRRISIAQKARWAKRRSSAQAVATTAKRTVSAASRRKMAAAQRARWAKVKAKKG